MADGLTNYDYAELENCVGQMKKVNQTLIDQNEELKSQAQGLMATWDGDTATSYNQKAIVIQNAIAQGSDVLNELQTKLALGADDMKVTDKAGAKF